MKKIKKFAIFGFLSIIFLLFLQTVNAKLNDTELLNMAQTSFQENIPEEYRNEYSKISTRTFSLTSHPTVYEIWYQRMINNIPISDDRFYIWIDANTGEIIQKDLSYSYKASELDTTATITNWQATQIALNVYGGELASSKTDNPFLVIKNKDLLWMVNLQLSSGRLELGLDANTGETKFFNPTVGFNIQQVPTHFDPPWYQPIILHPEYAVVAIVAVAGTLVYLIKNSNFLERKFQS